MIKEEKRQSNFELMRIISMFMIIIWHIFLHGKIFNNATPFSGSIFYLLSCLLTVHINSFILLSGYFGYNKKVKLSKVFKLNNAIWFYVVVFTFIFKYLNISDISNYDVFKAILPISIDDYWFMTNYLILYLLSPLFNTVINNVDQSKLRKILITWFILLNFLPWVTGEQFLNVNSGYSFINFSFLYMLGAYLRLYPIDKNIHFKNYSDTKIRVISLVLYFSFCIINFLVLKYCESLIYVSSKTLNNIGYDIIHETFSYINPFTVVATVFYFIYFSKLNFNNKFINKISGYVFGIYLVHDNKYVRGILYNYLGFNNQYYNISILPKVLLCSILIFLISLIIEIIRQFIFKFIYKRKISFKFRNVVKNYIKDYGIDVNW